MRWKRISDAVVRRLPLYLRVLENAADQEMMSSQELGERAGVSPALIRKDLAWFGEFGKQGVGYEVAYLREELRKILNLDKPIPMVLVGVGSLGYALARYNRRKFLDEPGFNMEIVALFDANPEVIGKTVEGVTIEPVADLAKRVKELNAKVGIICVPAEHAQAVADELVVGGVKAILNFAPVKISVPDHVEVTNEDLSLELQRLAYYVND